MKRKGHTSLRRASLDRISLRKKKRSNMETTSIVGNVESDLGNSSSSRTVTHKTSHQQFLNWVTYSRDLSPEITGEQQRTCPVCESSFRDRRSMLQHICKCPQLNNGFYRCIHCNKRERIGRYHMNGCSNVHVCQDNWLKRMLSFRSSEVLVDDSETYSVEVDSARAAWERIELPCETFAGLDARTHRVEMATNTAVSTSYPTAELDGDWPVLELDSGVEAWGSIERPPWQPAEAEEVYGWPRVEMDGGWVPAEMSSQPAELPADGDNASGSPKPASAFGINYQESNNVTSLPIHEVDYAHLDHDLPAVDCGNVDEQTTYATTTHAEMPKQPNLRLKTENLAPRWQYTHANNNFSSLCHSMADRNACESFPGTVEEFSHNSIPGAQFPSPPTSPFIRSQYDTPVSPLEENSRSSRYSSLSSILMSDTPMSSFSSVKASVEDNHASSARVFDDREMCSEPDDMESFPSSFSADMVEETVFHNSNFDAASTSSMSLVGQSTGTGSFDFEFTSISCQHEYSRNYYSSKLSTSNSPENLMMRPKSDAASFSPEMENYNAAMNRFDIEFSHTGFRYNAISPRRSSGSDASWNPPLSTTPSDDSPTSEQDLTQSFKFGKNRPLARSPAVRDVEDYKCTYGGCKFMPTGKRAYHKRTLQRHQEKCFYYPLPREKKPCKCTFPGCNKGFSRSDGLNAHRKTSGHQAKFELQLKETNHQIRESVGFL